MITTETQAIALVPSERAALALKSTAVETELRALVVSSADITAVIDKAGREQAHRIAMVLKAKRVDIEKDGKAARDDATKFSKAVIAEEDRLIAIIKPEETRVLALRDGYDAEAARIDAERLAKERARMEVHENGIKAIYAMPGSLASGTAADVMAVLDKVADKVAGEEWEEYRVRAATAYAEVLDQLEALYKAKLAAEEAARVEAEEREAERVRAQRQALELAAQREAQEIESKRLAALAADLEAKAKAAADIETTRAAAEKAERDRVAAENKRQLEEQQAAINEARRVADEEMESARRKLAADQKQFADMLAAQAAAEQLERDHAEALAMNAEWVAPVKHVLNLESIVVSVGGVECKPHDDPHAMDEGSAEIAAMLPTLRLGQIAERLSFKLSQADLSALGFEPSGRDKAAVLYHEHQFPMICEALKAKIDAAKLAWVAA